MKITRTDLIILAMISRKPMHGWEIDENLAEMGANLWAEYSRPHLYYSLRKLEKEGYIKLINTTSGRPQAKKVFKPTDKGEEVLKEKAIASSLAYRPTYFDFDLLLGLPEQFCTQKSDLKRLMEQRGEALQKELAETQQYWQTAEIDSSLPFGRFAVIKHRIKFLKSEIEFLKWLEKNAPDNW